MPADSADLTNGLVTLLQAGQVGLLRLTHALGLSGDAAGQAAWPFARRVAVETLAIDAGLAREVAVAIAAALLAIALLALGATWRRGRWPAWAVAVTMALVAPWPAPSLLLADAVPTSFQHPPTAFDAEAITRGLALYQARCASCHGADGRGETARAATLPTWPPRLTGGLLWRRDEGELLWRIRHGVGSMPGDMHLTDADTWAVIAGLRALAAGDSARTEGLWQWPIRAPGLAVRCDDATHPLSHWRGQRLRIVIADGSAAVPREDPRFVTVVLSTRPSASGCRTASPAALQAYATIAGIAPAALPGTQFIVDRDGWLRALSAPGSARDGAWSADRLLCRSVDAGRGEPKAAGDGLGDLIRQMDADPVRMAGLGIPHGR